jgi:pimeloyl-ACP methyl ester carboxylesterase
MDLASQHGKQSRDGAHLHRPHGEAGAKHAMNEIFTIEVGGRKIAARWFGDPARSSADAIVLLHQGLGSITQWRDFPTRLAQATSRRVFAYDRSGHGRSELCPGRRAHDFIDVEATEVLPALLDAIGITRPVLYGHSDGGTIALLHAAMFPDVAKAVITEAAHVFLEDISRNGIGALMRDYELGELRAGLQRHHGDGVDTLFRNWSETWRSPAMAFWRIDDRLGALRAPLLIVQGAADDHGTLAQVRRIAMAVNGQVTTLVLPGIGHAPNLEATDAVATGVSTFLRESFSDA